MMASRPKRSTTNAARFRKQIAKTKANCHICGKPIDYTLPHLDDGAFVIDHIKPLKLGGTDTIENIAAAHRACNSKKRARAFAPIIRRSGALE